MTTGMLRYPIAETVEQSCQRVTYELITFGLSCALECGCGRVMLHSNNFAQVFKKGSNVWCKMFAYSLPGFASSSLNTDKEQSPWDAMKLCPDQIVHMFCSSVFFRLFLENYMISISSYNPAQQSRIEALRRQLFAKCFPIIP